MNKFVIKCLFVLLMFYQCKAQNKVSIPPSPYFFINTIESQRQYVKAVGFSNRGNSYQFMDLRGYLDTNNVLIKKQNKENVIEFQWLLINNVVNSAQISKDIKHNKSPFKDNYKSWVSLSERSMFNQEVPLYEGYSFYYITQFLYYTKINGWSGASLQNKKKWYELLSFIETNIWTKWYERSFKEKGNYYYYFLGRRTHMGSHWAGIAMYLNKLSDDTHIINQTAIMLNQYDILLKRNLQKKEKGYIWNSTYDNVEGTLAYMDKGNQIQDVSHGNHVVTYIVAAYEMENENWTFEDIKRLSYTLKEFIYNNEKVKF